MRTATIVQPGDRFGRLTVLGVERRGDQRWLHIRCECGTEKVRKASPILCGETRSCGCLNREASSERNRRHGAWGTAEYKAWVAMKARCYDPNTTGFEGWGGRGIGVCNRWLHNFGAFVADMGPRPTPQHSLDRINNDGHYEPSNCRWATKSQQSANQRPRRRSAAAS